jgi:hypothetical protein
VKYERPQLTHLGHVAGLTESDIKCSVGFDLGHSQRWAHPNTAPWTHWTFNSAQATPAQLLESGDCQWVELL